MAEKEGGIIEGLTGGGEPDEQETEEINSRAESEATSVATIVAMDAARYDPELSRKAGEYLEKQNDLVLASTALVKLQVHHFDEERKLSIQAAKRKRFFDHLRMSFQICLTLIAASIALGAIIIVRDAVNSRNVIVDAFDTPHLLIEQGLTGKTVSVGLLDVLSRIQAATRSDAERRSLSNAWTNDIAIEVAETGMSIGEIVRILNARFGHDQHIDGEVVLTEHGGLALTVRGTGILAKTFSDDTHDLDKLLTDAGEYIYGQSQPGLFANYLYNSNRHDDAIRFVQTHYLKVDVSEKPYMLNYLGLALLSRGNPGSKQEALQLFRQELLLKPDYWAAYNNIMFALDDMGDEEDEIKEGKQLLQAAGGRPGRAPEKSFQNYDLQLKDMSAFRAENLADMESHGGIGTGAFTNGSANLNIARAEAFLHDVESATLRVNTTTIEKKYPVDILRLAMVKALLAEEVGDLKTAANEWDTAAEALSDPANSTIHPQRICAAALTYQKTGQPAKADAIFDAPTKASGYSTFIDCYRFKGDVLDLRGDWAGAQIWYANAVKLAPDSPSGYYSFGLALLKHGDLNGAAEQLKLANEKGPHWADPLKVWGDLLLKQGHPGEALVKYDDAVKYAPNWTQLNDAREIAMKEKG